MHLQASVKKQKMAAYVVTLVHGTWAPQAAWTQRDSFFRRQLETGINDTVAFERFSWSGENTHAARIAAGIRARLPGIDESQERFVSRTSIPELARVPIFCSVFFGDEAGFALRMAHVIAFLPLYTLPALTVALYARLLFWGGPPLVEAYREWLLDKLRRTDIGFKQKRGLLFLALLPISLLFAIVLAIVLPLIALMEGLALGGTVAESLLMRVTVAPTPPGWDAGQLTVVSPSLLSVVHGPGWNQRMRHLMRFGLIHGLTYADSNTVAAIASWMRETGAQHQPGKPL